MVWRRVWRSLTDPPHQRPVIFVAYAVTIFTGVMTLIMPPRTIESELGPALTVTWALLMLVGGVVGLGTILTRWWWVERLGIATIILGLTVYGSVVLTLHFVTPGSRATQLGVIVLAGLLFMLRLAAIREWSYAPRRSDVTPHDWADLVVKLGGGAIAVKLLDWLIPLLRGREARRRAELDRVWRERDREARKRRRLEEFATLLRRRLLEAPCVDDSTIPPWPALGDTGPTDTTEHR